MVLRNVRVGRGQGSTSPIDDSSSVSGNEEATFGLLDEVFCCFHVICSAMLYDEDATFFQDDEAASLKSTANSLGVL